MIIQLKNMDIIHLHSCSTAIRTLNPNLYMQPPQNKVCCMSASVMLDKNNLFCLAAVHTKQCDQL